MKRRLDADAVERLLAGIPEIERVRIDAGKRAVKVGFFHAVPDARVLEKIDASLGRELPDPEAAVHPPEAAHPDGTDGKKAWVHHHHLGAGVIEFHRAHTGPNSRLAWKAFKIPHWQNRPPAPDAGMDYRWMLALCGLCGAAALAWWVAADARLELWIVWPLLAVTYVVGGWYAAREVGRELRNGRIDVHFLVLVAAVGALFVNAVAEGVTLLFLFSLSGALEQFAHDRAQKTIGSLLKASPRQALRRHRGAWVEVPIGEVRLEDELLVKPGELFPVDGTVIEGITAVDESALSGDSIPVAKCAADSVSGGTLNLNGQAVIRVARLPQESAVQRIVTLIETAQHQKAPAQRFTDAFSRYFTCVMLALCAVVFVVLTAQGHRQTEALYRAMTLLVVASPCALVLAIPSVVLVAIASGARSGILFRGGMAVENLASVTQFAFDKTGTLTRGDLHIARIEAMEGVAESDVLRLAASVGQFSTHPLARAIVSEAQRRGLKPDAASNFRTIAGMGMQAQCGEGVVYVGSRALLGSQGIVLAAKDDCEHVEVWVASASPLGVIYLSDEVRPEARETIERLRQAGTSVALVTGDRARVALDIAGTLGVTDVRAALDPEEKLECIHRWQAEGGSVAMVGDGINDALSLTAADVAIGMGARGFDATLAQADVILMHNRIENVANALALSRRARAIIRQNIALSLGVALLLAVLALWSQIGLTLGVVGREGSTMIVLLNGLRLLRLRREG